MDMEDFIDKAKLTARRNLALYHLRVNPKNVKQAKRGLIKYNGDRCALGLIAQAFDIPCSSEEMDAKGLNGHPYSPYRELDELLGIDSCFIFRLNDNDDLTFAEIADRAEQAFETGEWDKKEKKFCPCGCGMPK